MFHVLTHSFPTRRSSDLHAPPLGRRLGDDEGGGIAPALEKLLLLNVLLEVRHRVETGNERTFRGSRYVEHGVLLSGPIAQVFERTILRDRKSTRLNSSH